MENKEIEIKIQDNIALRSSYMTYILALTSGVIVLFFLSITPLTI